VTISLFEKAAQCKGVLLLLSSEDRLILSLKKRKMLTLSFCAAKWKAFNPVFV